MTDVVETSHWYISEPQHAKKSVFGHINYVMSDVIVRVVEILYRIKERFILELLGSSYMIQW